MKLMMFSLSSLSRATRSAMESKKESLLSSSSLLGADTANVLRPRGRNLERNSLDAVMFISSKLTALWIVANNFAISRRLKAFPHYFCTRMDRKYPNTTARGLSMIFMSLLINMSRVTMSYDLRALTFPDLIFLKIAGLFIVYQFLTVFNWTQYFGLKFGVLVKGDGLILFFNFLHL